MPAAPFSLVILETRSLFLSRPTWTTILLLYTSFCSWNDRFMPPCPAVFHWVGVLQTFMPGLSWNWSPPYLSFPHSLRWQVWATTPDYWLRCVPVTRVGHESQSFKSQPPK
jgi:hypothetical protein